MAILFPQADCPFGSPGTLLVHGDVIALHVFRDRQRIERHNAASVNLCLEILHMELGILGENIGFGKHSTLFHTLEKCILWLPGRVRHTVFHFFLFNMTKAFALYGLNFLYVSFS